MQKVTTVLVLALALSPLLFVAGCGKRNVGHVKNNPSQTVASNMGQNGGRKGSLVVPPP
jgi:hypothetical protein